jgi:hypothetical protein
MRSNQSKRMRGRNNRKSQNPLSRVYESNGPDVKVRGSAAHIAEKYIQLARDAQGSGDPVAAENYYQHAEHYFRLIAAVQEQYRQAQPFYRPDIDSRGDEPLDDSDDDAVGGEPGYGPREPQPYTPREAQPYPAHEPQPQFARPQPQAPAPQPEASSDLDRLPSFITGGGPQQAQGNGQNGHQQADRFPLHRRRRRHRGARGEAPSAPPAEDARPAND